MTFTSSSTKQSAHRSSYTNTTYRHGHLSSSPGSPAAASLLPRLDFLKITYEVCHVIRLKLLRIFSVLPKMLSSLSNLQYIPSQNGQPAQLYYTPQSSEQSSTAQSAPGLVYTTSQQYVPPFQPISQGKIGASYPQQYVSTAPQTFASAYTGQNVYSSVYPSQSPYSSGVVGSKFIQVQQLATKHFCKTIIFHCYSWDYFNIRCRRIRRSKRICPKFTFKKKFGYSPFDL